MNVLAKNGSMSIQVGANDGQTINIDLQQIDSSTLGLNGFSVSKNSLSVGASITQVVDNGSTGTAGSMVDVNLSDVAKNLGVDASTLSLHNVTGTDQYVVQSGSDYYSVSVGDSSVTAGDAGKVKLNTTDVTYGDYANGIASNGATMSDQYIKVGVDSTTKAVSAFVTIQGKTLQLMLMARITARTLPQRQLLPQLLILNLAILLTPRVLLLLLQLVSSVVPHQQIHWLCWTKQSRP